MISFPQISPLEHYMHLSTTCTRCPIHLILLYFQIIFVFKQFIDLITMGMHYLKIKNNIWWRTQIMNLFIMPFPPVLSYFHWGLHIFLDTQFLHTQAFVLPTLGDKFHTHLKQQGTLWFSIFQSLYSGIANRKKRDSTANGSMNSLSSISLYLTFIKLTNHNLNLYRKWHMYEAEILKDGCKVIQNLVTNLTGGSQASLLSLLKVKSS